MILNMDKASAPSSKDLARRLYDKNVELENRGRRSSLARIPFDSNTWRQMRENFESIILEDHAFSEQNGVEYALWQLHYRRIEEFRAHFSATIPSRVSKTTQDGEVLPRPDRIEKTRVQFKIFLSEATGFYHDLILKIRSKYGLPLNYLSEDSENQFVLEKNEKKLKKMKKGLVSCQRCLIYLGDLARYKGLYGEGDSRSRDYAAASSYYLHAASLWPSSGNPHHQLAILASYSGDEFVAIYRYFRSLAAESPFTTARDNLIVAFEKNRQGYLNMLEDSRGSAEKGLDVKMASKGRGKGGTEYLSKHNNNVKAAAIDEKGKSSIPDMFKAFCISFVRVNGILFTRTSLETFSEILSLASSSLLKLLSSGSENELNFGANAAENGLFIVRLACILIFTVHNANGETESQAYAEILQRTALLECAFTAVFELMGHILKRCARLREPSSSCLLPGIMVFLEWLACCPDVSSGRSVDETLLPVRLRFWSGCASFFNNLLSEGLVPMEDEDEICFSNMCRYEEGDTEHQLALWEDFELRGFLPVAPAQVILDFSRKPSFGSDGFKERKVRVSRILAAGKVLVNIVKLGERELFFDSKMKKFDIDVPPQTSDYPMGVAEAEISKLNGSFLGPEGRTLNSGGPHLEEDEEVIVFKPTSTEKRSGDADPICASREDILSCGGSQFDSNYVSTSLASIHQKPAVAASTQSSGGGMQCTQPQASMWSAEQDAFLANSLKGLGFLENGFASKSESRGSLQSASPSFPPEFSNHVQRPIGVNVPVNSSFALPTISRKSPVRRPVTRLGPPPGFDYTHIPPKQESGPISVPDTEIGTPLMDDYCWLDGYQLPSSSKATHLDMGNKKDVFKPISTFPYPGKQIPGLPFQEEVQNGWSGPCYLQPRKPNYDLQLQQQKPFINGSDQFVLQEKKNQGSFPRIGRYLV